MNYLDNDYLIPVILGGGKDATRVARLVFDKTGIRPRVFAFEFSLEQKLLCKCSKFPTRGDFIMISELCAFAEKHDSEGSLLLIFTEENTRFIKDHSDEIESRFITVSAHELLQSFIEE